MEEIVLIKKKILIVTDGYLPAQNYGGPLVSIDNLCSLLKDEIHFDIVTTEHEMNCTKRMEEINDGWNKRNNAEVLYLPETKYKMNVFAQIINERKPECIYLNSLFSKKSTIPFLKLAKKNNIPIILAPRGQLCKNAFKKKWKKIPYIILYSNILNQKKLVYQATSEEEREAIKKYLHVEDKKIVTLNNIPSLPLEERAKKQKNKGRLDVVYISRIHPKKNLRYALEIVKEASCFLQFDIYGPIEDLLYWKECKKIIYEMPKNINVRYCGIVPHQDIHASFSAYDLFLFPTFSENYGHVIAEALFSGCPVITSDNVPWLDLEKNNAGWAISLDNRTEYKERICQLSEEDDVVYSIRRNNCYQYVYKKSNYTELRIKYLRTFAEFNYEE